MLSMTRNIIKTKSLIPWVKFIWYFEAENADIHYKLLPTDGIDIILNFSGNMVYEVNSRCISSTPFHINGLRSEHSYIHQTGDICVFGISCYPFGLYPFVNKSLSVIHDEVVDLYDISTSLSKKLELVTANKTTTDDVIANIERILCEELQVTDDYINTANLIYDFLEMDSTATIQSFCLEHGINTKTFTRNVRYYTGYTPKILRSINRFQKTGNQLIHHTQKPLSYIAYDNGFADQAHFIREFHKFSGVAPRAFQKEKNTVKENINYKYQ